MEDDILRAANIEIERLEGLLHNHPLYQRLQALRQVISSAAKNKAPTRRRFRAPGRQKNGVPVRGLRRQRFATARGVLRQKGARASSGEIYQALVLNGVTIVGKKPTAVVASYLSHSDMLQHGPRWLRSERMERRHGDQFRTRTLNSSELFGAPQGNGASPLHP